jgi:hypothetical protein
MAKVYGIHEIELHPGVDEESFIKICKEIAEIEEKETGWKHSLLKGDRGQRAGKYAVMIEIESVEERDRIAPTPDLSSEEQTRWLEEHRALVELKKKRAAFSPTDIGAHKEFTDYILLT